MLIVLSKVFDAVNTFLLYFFKAHRLSLIVCLLVIYLWESLFAVEQTNYLWQILTSWSFAPDAQPTCTDMLLLHAVIIQLQHILSWATFGGVQWYWSIATAPLTELCREREMLGFHILSLSTFSLVLQLLVYALGNTREREILCGLWAIARYLL